MIKSGDLYLFQRVFTASADLAATFGTDIGSAVESLGYALESPVDGITRLRRQGIFVSEEMTQQITYLTEQNRKYEAQLLLLDEVESKVKGTAEAIAEASASSSLSTSWNKLTGELGKSIENINSSFKTGLSWLLNGMTSAMEEYNFIRLSALVKDGVRDKETTADVVRQCFIAHAERGDCYRILKNETAFYENLYMEDDMDLKKSTQTPKEDAMRENLFSDAEQNKADIAFVAMMSGIDLLELEDMDESRTAEEMV